MKRKYLILSFLIVLVLAIVFKLYSNKKIINEKNTPDVSHDINIPVLVNKVQYKSVENTINKTANLVPNKKAIVYAATGGNLQKIYFDLGTHVQAGQIMALTDTRKVAIDLQNAIASQEKLQNDVKIYTELLTGKATTQEKLQQLKLDYTNAKNKTEQIRKEFTDAKVKAPISGVVVEKKVEQGMFLSSGGEVATIVDINKLKIQVYLTESEVYKVGKGDVVTFKTDIYPDRIFNGTITFISPEADATHNYLVEVLIANSANAALKAGTFVYASFSKKASHPVLTISRSALVESAEKPTVYVVVNNHAVAREIQLGSNLGDDVEVVYGLKEGDVVVVSGQINLKDKSAVTISNKIVK